MKYIVIDPAKLTLAVAGKRAKTGVSFRATPRFYGDSVRHRVADRILHDVLYPARESRDAKAGRKRKYCLYPPDPWLLAIGIIMWQGIIA